MYRFANTGLSPFIESRCVHGGLGSLQAPYYYYYYYYIPCVTKMAASIIDELGCKHYKRKCALLVSIGHLFSTFYCLMYS
jgi:hypothetical protein